MPTVINKELLQKSQEEHKDFMAMVSRNKYQFKNEITFEDVKDRVTRNVHDILLEKVNTRTASKASYLIEMGHFIPAGSILSGIENDSSCSLSNCYLTPIKEDSIEGIFDCLKHLARTFSYRGGSGVVLDILRPRNTPVNNAARSSTGAVSFMPLFSESVKAIGQNGRRGAMIMSMDVRHPDIMDFIDAKAHPETVFERDAITGSLPTIEGANISVMANDDFMVAVREDANFTLWFPDIGAAGKDFYNENWDGDFDKWAAAGLPIEEYVTYKARDIMAAITKANHKCGDPGLLFKDRLQQWTMGTHIHESLKPMGVNPCVTGDTPIYTREGNKPIAECVDQEMEVWNGYEWTTVTPRVTGEDQEIFRVFLDNGRALNCTGYHGFSTLSYGDLTTQVIANLLAVRQTVLLDDFDHPVYGAAGFLQVLKVEKLDTIAEKVYCYTDPIRGRAMFNDISTKNCGEQPLGFGSNCLLGATVLPEYVSNAFTTSATFNEEMFLKDIHTAVYIMNAFSVINRDRHPLKEQREADEFSRRIGIEMTGLGDMLAMMGIRYGSAAAIHFVRDLAKKKARAEIKASVELAMNTSFGCAPALATEESRKSLIACDYMQSLMYEMPGNDFGKLVDDFEKYGMANTGLNTIGPCGSISIMSNNCTSGIEPLFKFAYDRRNKIDGKTYSFIHKPAADHMLKNLELFEGLTLQEAKQKLCYQEADEVSYTSRLEMQAALQKYTDASISSTLNLPESATPEMMAAIFQEAHSLGLKGVTVFRDNCKQGVLSATKEPEAIPAQVEPQLPALFKKGLLDTEEATRHRIMWKKAKLYIIVSTDGDEKPIEVFAKLPVEAGLNGGGFFNPTLWQERTSNWDLACRLISLLLRYGVPLEEVLEQLRKSAYTMVDVASVLKRVLAQYAFMPEEEIDSEDNPENHGVCGQECPECKQLSYFHEGGCAVCRECGFTTCG